MARYIIRPLGKNWQVLDNRAGVNVEVATFVELELAQHIVGYLNKKDELIELVLDQLSDDIDIDFSGEL